MYVFMGGSISSRDAQEAAGIAGRVKKLCQILDDLGHTYDVALLSDPKIHREAKAVEFEIPEKYLASVPDSIVDMVKALRVDNAPYSLKDEIACYNWSLDLLEKCGAAIWDLTKSSSGSGYELALALQLKKPCLALFNRPTISTMINGNPSRLLTVARWGDDSELEETVRRFLNKASEGLDRSIKVNISQGMASFIENRVKQGKFRNVSEFIRYLVERDQEKTEG